MPLSRAAGLDERQAPPWRGSADSAADGIGIVHLDPLTGGVLAANAAFCAICGYTGPELLVTTLERLDPPGECADETLHAALLRGDEAPQTQRRLLRKDGTTCWVQVASSVLRDAQGQPQCVVGVVKDIGTRREAEAALHAHAARQSLLVRLNDGLRRLQDPRAIVRAAARLLGEFLRAQRVGFAEAQGDGRTVVIAPGAYHRGVPALPARRADMDNGCGVLCALRAGRTIVRHDVAQEPGLAPHERALHAAHRIAASIDVPLANGQGAPAVLFVHASAPRAWTSDEVALVEDVAERIRADVQRAQAEAGVRASKAKLEAALASMNDAVFITDAEGNFVDFNAAFASFHRFRDKQRAMKTLREVPGLLEMSEADGTPAPLERWPVPRALRGETGSNVEYGLRRRDSGECWTGSFSFAPIRDADGCIVGSVTSARDITELRRIRSELQASHGELQRLIAAQDGVLEGERLRIARELHDDLQQSLAAILMEASVVRASADALDGDGRAALERIEQLSIDVISSMRRIILDLRPQALEELGLVSALQTLATSFAERAGIECSLDVSALRPDDQPRLAPVATCLYRVVQEALNNVARHAGAQRVAISVASGPAGDLLLSVADDGVGMLLAARAKPGSYGLLGMRERVRVAGGTLGLRTAPGRGTTIEVRLPAGPAAR